jgi:hypothetical protein
MLGSEGQARSKLLSEPMRLKYEMTLDQIRVYALMDDVESPRDELTRSPLHALKTNRSVETPDNQLTYHGTNRGWRYQRRHDNRPKGRPPPGDAERT